MKHVFGPVPSRRLGQSLGIDPIPLKTCNWNCLYCQLGRTRPLTNKRMVFFPPKDILAEVRSSLAHHDAEEIDWITFVGSGETALFADLGWLIQGVKELTALPIAVITNGSLLYLPEVRQDMILADAVLPSLDAGTPQLYRRINRPHPEATFKRLLEGLIRFREEYKGNLWVEVMLVKDLNDTEEALQAIAKALQQVQPDEIHILLPTRAPAESWVLPAEEEGVLRAQAILGKTARVIHPSSSGEFDLSGYDNLVDAIVGIITRHPMRDEELKQTLTYWVHGDAKKIDDVLKNLVKNGQAQVVERYGIRFWTATPSYFPDKK